ncbi:hypothetical protein N7449_011876 [Penicillium cf. viridicatum]|uniref:Uncharacterized protein n=1 Tax=Penicillium cf. viridicatum TaxID=2972119 RepID=A0A9W9IPN3_9EURO|nr:hypothetical protein N7449_011876 [Penicillium cf. viridicatum]
MSGASIDSGYIEPSNGRGYVFKGDRYVCIKVIPGTTIDQINWGPKPYAEPWNGVKYARINFKYDKVIFGPAPITGHWPSLDKAGFPTIDAILPTPGEPNHAYVFYKDQYARVTLTPLKSESSIVYGPAPISKGWPALASARIHRLDAVIPAPGLPNDAYFFLGDKYVRLTVEPGTVQDKVVFGPASVVKRWPALKDL